MRMTADLPERSFKTMILSQCGHTRRKTTANLVEDKIYKYWFSQG